ncbi:MAG TPA: lysylphosphatidylglycerol synthase transmembrane domain-containing protein [Gaiellaceae bacterium]|nr:lysylphosphatidylglycerol synthase transmembrane domain-containing protein [Gaiellaceae bacterium]
MSRPLRVALQLAVSGAIVAFLLWRIDLAQTAETLRESNYAYVAGAYVIFIASTWPMAWRWWALLRARGIQESYNWLVRMYFVSYTAGQVLPTAVGGDAVRIIEHARRRPDARATVTGAVVMERLLGAAGTLVLVAFALVVAVGRYQGAGLLALLGLAFLATLGAVGVLLFSPEAGRQLDKRLFPLGRRFRLEDPLRSLWTTMHEYRRTPYALLAVVAVTVAAQGARVVAIWLCGEAVGIDVSPVVYIVLGPLLFLVQMTPFTLNGLGVREAFFVVFLGRFGVSSDAALATGILFYAVTIASALPGALYLLWRSVRPGSPAGGRVADRPR